MSENVLETGLAFNIGPFKDGVSGAAPFTVQSLILFLREHNIEFEMTDWAKEHELDCDDLWEFVYELNISGCDLVVGKSHLYLVFNFAGKDAPYACHVLVNHDQRIDIVQKHNLEDYGWRFFTALWYNGSDSYYVDWDW